MRDNRMMRSGQFTTAAAQPRMAVGDVSSAVDTHAVAILRAHELSPAGVDLVVFPELSLTGYDLAAREIDIADPRLRPLSDACATTGATALVGAPVVETAGTYIAMVRVDPHGIGIVYRKSFPGADEARRFDAGPGPAVIDVDGVRVGLGICRDTGVDAHITATAALGIDLYACGVVHHDTERQEQERRARRLAVACGAPVVMASCAGPTGEGYRRTAGVSAVWSADGECLTAATDQPGDVVVAGLDQISRR
ncbi:carbon-nitrogen hydrolase family protein [Gordonia amicalis]|uniref:carbon-nitrogen hydrolase family protein n=1 Tax=Gordonia amicalis TaxID=89053 RepID=UPI0022A6CC8E|nr:carbon-nitrogen hydrolase family protein [Gordonia amicalis]MCZ0912148.1 carbon-nitrogen hydrolase family protein [Gordonia amicalis]